MLKMLIPTIATITTYFISRQFISKDQVVRIVVISMMVGYLSYELLRRV